MVKGKRDAVFVPADENIVVMRWSTMTSKNSYRLKELLVLSENPLN